MLGLVLGLLIAVLYVTRQMFLRQSGSAGKGVIRMLSSYHIAPKERIILMDVLGEKILIGVTPQQIQCLAKISADRDIEVINDSATNGFFTRFLKEAIGKRS